MRWADNVVEESTTTTTGAYQLGGVPASGEAPGAQTFVAGIGDTQTCYYYAKEVSGTAWERGIGTVTDAATDTLTRTTIHGSSNGGAAVDWTGKTVRVYCVAPAHALRRMTLDHAGLLDNATFTVTRSGNAETISLKTAAGNDPSAADPVRVAFVNTTGGFDVLEGTSALSFTFSSGSTGGAVNNLEFKAGILLLNNAGTLALGAVVRPSGVKDNSIVSTTAEGGAGAADSPRVIYSASALTNVRARVLGYATYTLAAVGTWDTAPTDRLLTRAGAMEVQVKELLYDKTLGASGNFDTNEWWPSGTMPSSYDELEISMLARATDNANPDIKVYLNGDTTLTNYRYAQVYGGTSTSGVAGDDSRIAGAPGADNANSNYFNNSHIKTLSPGNTSSIKTLINNSGRRNTATDIYSSQNIVTWENTAAINRIQLVTSGASTNFVANSRVQIHGFKSVSILL
jgi:hypothetical protein